MTGKIKTGLSGALIFLTVFLGNCRAAETSEFVLTNRTFRSGDFEVKMLPSDNGLVEIYGDNQLLVKISASLGWTNTKFSDNPEISVNDKKNKLTMKFSIECKDGAKIFLIREIQAVTGELKLTTSVEMSNGKDPAGYFPAPLDHVNMREAGYDGGTWQSGPDKGLMLARSIPLENSQVWSASSLFVAREFDKTAKYPVKKISFWQKGRKLGFAIINTDKNGMVLDDWGSADRQTGAPQIAFSMTMYGTKYSAAIHGTTMLITPAWRTDHDLQDEAVMAKTSISFPAAERYGFFPVNYNLPAEVTIEPGKETAGNYTAEFLLLDQENKEILKKEMPIGVTEEKAGKVKFDFVTPQRCALYWLRISVKGKDGNTLLSEEYPLAITVKLPPIKDVPAASAALGGQPLSYIPGGELAGMKWDRIFTSRLSWPKIEPEKGKFDWETSDQMVEKTTKLGGEILFTLVNTPAWASRMPKENIYNVIKEKYPVAPELKGKMENGQNGERISKASMPRDIKDWENFVRAMVRRYKDKVHYWQIWNEPWWDIKKFGSPVGDVWVQLRKNAQGEVTDAEAWGFCGTPEDYAELVKSAARIIREEDPEAKIVVYGDYNAYGVAEEFYKTGAGDCIDILCLHYWSDYCHARKNIPPVGWASEKHKEMIQSLTAENNIIRELDQTHFKHTGKHAPIWNTEEGVYNCSSRGRSSPRPFTQKECEQLYGEKARQLFASMMSERQNARWMLQSVLFSFSVGVDKVFMHSGLRPVSVSGLREMGYKLPTEMGIAWAAMASVLNTSKEVKYAPMGNKELDAVTITDVSGKKTAVVWSHAGERKVSVRIPVGGGKISDDRSFLIRLAEKVFPALIKGKTFQGMDWLGNPVELKAEKGWLKIEASEEPLYIHDLDLEGIFISGKDFISFKAGEKNNDVLQAGKPYQGELVVGNPYAGHSIDGVLEASIRPGGNVTFNEKKVKLAPGEQKTIPFNIMPGKEETRVEFILKEQDVELGRVEKSYLVMHDLMATPLPKCPRTIKADGESGDWEGVAEYKVNTADRVLVGLETPAYEKAPVRIWQGPDDLSFTVRTCWQEDGLYFLVEVKDNEVNAGPEASCQWDCVELFVDTRDAVGQARKEKTAGAVQISVQPSLSDQPQECKVSFAGDDGKYAQAFFMGRKTKTGYVVEGRIAPVGIQLKEGVLIGLDAAVDDGQEPNPQNAAARKSQMIWLGTQDNYKDTSRWGKFYLGQ